MKNSIKYILPKMVQVSNNSRLTMEVATSIASKLNTKEFEDFQWWLKLIK